jgi:hypothetical protein
LFINKYNECKEQRDALKDKATEASEKENRINHAICETRKTIYLKQTGHQ